MILVIWIAVLVAAFGYIFIPRNAKKAVKATEKQKKLEAIKDVLKLVYKNAKAHVDLDDPQIMALPEDELVMGVLQLMLEHRISSEIIESDVQQVKSSPEDEFEQSEYTTKKVTYH